MAYSVKVPAVGESINEVTVANWIRQNGETVRMDEVIAELESEKATFELTAPVAGKLLVKKLKGESVPVGEVICEIEESISAPVTSAAPVVEKKDSASAPETSKPTGGIKEMKVPAVGESINEVTISSWLKKDGDFVRLDEVIAEVESDKATFELPAEANGILRIVAKAKETLPIGGLICRIELADVPASTPSAQKPAVSTTGPKVEPASAPNYASGHPSPAAAKILDEKGVTASAVAGTGPGGRITKEDAVKAAPVAAAKQASASASGRGKRSEKMTSLRKTISKRLVAVKNETAMLTTFNEIDMKPVMDLRARYKEKFKEKYGVGLGFMSFFTRAVCVALKEWPAVNAQINGDEVIYHEYCDISIAVSTPRGLVVPVIRNAENLSFHEIESEIARLAGRGREGKLSIDEMTGGTFSITNGGVFGSMLSTPILNPPQSAILGMHNIVERPVVKDGQIVIRPVMYLALSYDHRIVDGRESVSFLVRVKELLEDPGRLVLEI